MFRRVPVVLAAAFLLAVVSPGWAFEPATTGVVVIHGKWGRPGDRTIGPFALALHDAGFMVEQPEMPWSGTRLYDRGFDQAMDEIDAAVARLRAAGAKKIVVAGHSQGGSAALRYDALGRSIDAVVLIAPAPLPEGGRYRALVADDVAKAQAMVASGHGEERADFDDPNSDNRSRRMRIKASIYLSYNAPNGPAAMTDNVQRVGAVPLLWVAPRFDPLTAGLGRVLWPKVPPTTPAARVEIIADHMGAPTAGRDAIIDWLRKLD